WSSDVCSSDLFPSLRLVKCFVQFVELGFCFYRHCFESSVLELVVLSIRKLHVFIGIFEPCFLVPSLLFQLLGNPAQFVVVPKGIPCPALLRVNPINHHV